MKIYYVWITINGGSGKHIQVKGSNEKYNYFN